MWEIVFTKDAAKDKQKLDGRPQLLKKVHYLLEVIKNDPFSHPCEKLIGDLKGCYSRRINIQHRLVYKVHKDVKMVQVLSMWDHYEK